MDVRGILEKLGYKDLVPADWYTRITEWRDWYKGETDWHKYFVYNGTKHSEHKRRSLGMAKKVCEDKADLLLNERVQIVVTPKAEAEINRAQEILDSVLEDNNFWVQGNQLMETANSLGTGAFVEFQNEISPGVKRVVIDYIPAEYIFPLSWSNGKITECAFASAYTGGKDGVNTYINLHVLDKGKYVIYNNVYDKEGKAIELPSGMLPEVKTGSAVPLFQIIKPNIVNNLCDDIPMGLSIFANAIDVLKGIDLVYDSYQNEFVLGKKRIFVDGSLCKQTANIDSDGNSRPIFDPKDTVFYSYPGEDAPEKRIVESNMDLRVTDHRMALQDSLDILSEKCGFGRGYYKFDADNVRTATEVISQNSQLYRKIRKDEILLESALVGLAKAVLHLSGYSGEVEVSVSFDDSIIEDTNAKAQRAMLEFQQGLIDEIEYHMQVHGMDEEAATKYVDKIRKRSPAPTDPFGFAPASSASSASAMPGAGNAEIDTAEVKNAAEDISGKRLNGAQVKSLMEVIAQYSASALSESAAINIIVSAFGMTEEEARKLLGLGDA
jgi:A118 family predicted phage portal protein